MYTPKRAELTMNRHNISALVMTMTMVAVISFIVGFKIYFSNSGLNQAWSAAATTTTTKRQRLGSSWWFSFA
jgi:hypothetical protein